MEDLWQRVVENLIQRVHGPLRFRFLLQPLMASIFAFIAGSKDARLGKPPYFWALITNPDHRREMLADGWKSVGKVFALAITLDVVYQLIELHTVYPGETILVAVALTIVPYLVVRGLVARLRIRWRRFRPSVRSPAQ